MSKLTLRDWHPGSTIYRVRILREMDGTEIGQEKRSVIRYARGTMCDCVLFDPERPGIADVQLPNGKLVRCALNDVSVMEQ